MAFIGIISVFIYHKLNYDNEINNNCNSSSNKNKNYIPIKYSEMSNTLVSRTRNLSNNLRKYGSGNISYNYLFNKNKNDINNNIDNNDILDDSEIFLLNENDINYNIQQI